MFMIRPDHTPAPPDSPGLACRRIPGIALTALLVVVGAACGREEPAPPAPPAEEVVERPEPEEEAAEIPEDLTRFQGEVYLTGSAVGTITMLSIEDLGGSLRLTGDLEPELRRLSGAIVEVRGERVRAYPTEGLEVSRYDIVRVDGASPHVGVLVLDEETDELRLRGDDGEELRLRGAPGDLRQQVDARVWIVGRVRNGALELASYGVVRPPR